MVCTGRAVVCPGRGAYDRLCGRKRRRNIYQSSHAAIRALCALDTAGPTPRVKEPILADGLVAEAAQRAHVPRGARKVLAPLARAHGAAVPDLGLDFGVRGVGCGFGVWGSGLGVWL